MKALINTIAKMNYKKQYILRLNVPMGLKWGF